MKNLLLFKHFTKLLRRVLYFLDCLRSVILRFDKPHDHYVYFIMGMIYILKGYEFVMHYRISSNQIRISSNQKIQKNSCISKQIAISTPGHIF